MILLAISAATDSHMQYLLSHSTHGIRSQTGPFKSDSPLERTSHNTNTLAYRLRLARPKCQPFLTQRRCHSAYPDHGANLKGGTRQSPEPTVVLLFRRARPAKRTPKNAILQGRTPSHPNSARCGPKRRPKAKPTTTTLPAALFLY